MATELATYITRMIVQVIFRAYGFLKYLSQGGYSETRKEKDMEIFGHDRIDFWA